MRAEPGSRPRPGLDRASAIADLGAGVADREVAERHGLSLAAVAGLRTFYELIPAGPRVCDGTACHFAGASELAARLARTAPVATVRCLGHCHSAPAFQSGDQVFAKPPHTPLEAWIDEWGETGEPHEDFGRIARASLARPAVVLRNLVDGNRRPGLHELDLPPAEAILEAIDAVGLRGRGGASFSTAAKWRAARDTPADERFVVANGDEGDPGSFVDRLLLEEDPLAVLAGLAACARVIGARRGIVYIRGEYARAQASMRRAIEQARPALGGLDVRVVSGAGSYVCGEETALLASIEGRRGEPRPKPPYPTECGLFGKPTVVQNVETLAVVPWIARHRRGAGTKAFSLSGAVLRPGVVEAPFGTPLRELLERCGGAPPGRVWKMALIGGPLGRVLPARDFDTPLAFETLPGMGHSGIVVLDDAVSPRALARHLFAFARAESCGGCAPCRLAVPLLDRASERAQLERLLETLEIGSACGFGQGVSRPIRDLLDHFGDEALGR